MIEIILCLYDSLLRFIEKGKVLLLILKLGIFD